MSHYIVNKSISIKATPEQVWDALTNPEKTKKYFFHCEVLSDWKPGSDIIFKGKVFFFFDIEMKGEILEINKGKLLKYSLKNGKEDDDEGNYSIVTDILTYENGETILSISDDVGDFEGAEKRMEKSEDGWDKILNGLKELVEKQNLENENME